mgnify:CR=1 FL=1
MSAVKDGGPAFPSAPNTQPGRYLRDGMSLRDYFAAKADQPGVAEVVTAAGLTCPDGISVWADSNTRIGTFTQWWGGLTNEDRFALSAKVRFQQADAMLRAREVQS